MGILSSLASWFKPRTKAASRGERFLMELFPGWQASVPFNYYWLKAEYVNHWNGWFYVANDAIATEVAGLPPTFAYRTDSPTLGKKRLSREQRRKALTNLRSHEEIEPVGNDHELIKLWDRPNICDVSWTFQYKMMMYLRLTGEAYIWKVPSKGAKSLGIEFCKSMDVPSISELWVIPSQWVRPCGGTTHFVDEYEIRPVAGYIAGDYGMGWFPGGAGIVRLPADQIVPILYPNPLTMWSGYSPANALSKWIDSAENIDKSRVAHFQNGMFPGVVLEIDKDILDPSPEMITRIIADLKAKYGTVMKTGEPILLGPGVTMKPITNTPQEMDYGTSGDQMRTWLMAGNKVPPSQIGMAEQTTYAAANAAKASYHQSTIKPPLTLLGQIFTEYLCKPLDPNLVMYWEDPQPDDPDYLLRKWDGGVKNGSATPNEYRQHVLNIDPFEHGGDDPLVPMSLSPLGIGTGAEPDELPTPAVAGDRWGVSAEDPSGKVSTEEAKGDAESNGKPNSPPKGGMFSTNGSKH